MAYFANRSLIMLSTCHWNLQRLAQEAIKDIDFTIICGYRDRKEQQRSYFSKASELQWPNSRHNVYPAEAWDFIPCPFTTWKDIEKFKIVAIVITAAAVRLGIPIETGALDWGWDFGHIQLKKEI